MNPRTDLTFFSTLIKSGSLTAAAREFDVTPSAVSKWLAQLEARLGVRLVARSTRRISLTNEGEVYLAEGRRILGEIDDLERSIASSRAAPVGLLKVNATLGFGRSFIAPAVSDFAVLYPDLEIQLLLTSRPMSLADGEVDLRIRFGEPRTPASMRARSPTIVAGSSPPPLTLRATAGRRSPTISSVTTASSFGRTTWRTDSGTSPRDGRPRPSRFAARYPAMTAQRRCCGPSTATAS